jgi:hypothetical protein
VATVSSIALSIFSYHRLLRMMQVSGAGNICFYTSALARQLSITVSFAHQVVLMQKLAFGVPNFPLVNCSFKLLSSSILFLENCEIVGLCHYGALDHVGSTQCSILNRDFTVCSHTHTRTQKKKQETSQFTIKEK